MYSVNIISFFFCLKYSLWMLAAQHAWKSCNDPWVMGLGAWGLYGYGVGWVVWTSRGRVCISNTVKSAEGTTVRAVAIIILWLHHVGANHLPSLPYSPPTMQLGVLRKVNAAVWRRLG